MRGGRCRSEPHLIFAFYSPFCNSYSSGSRSASKVLTVGYAPKFFSIIDRRDPYFDWYGRSHANENERNRGLNEDWRCRPGSVGTKGGTGADTSGPCEVLAGEIDGVYGNDFGIAVKGYRENHGLKPQG